MTNTTNTEGKIFGSETLKKGFASMVKGGVIMDVTNAEHARIAKALDVKVGDLIK